MDSFGAKLRSFFSMGWGKSFLYALLYWILVHFVVFSLSRFPLSKLTAASGSFSDRISIPCLDILVEWPFYIDEGLFLVSGTALYFLFRARAFQVSGIVLTLEILYSVLFRDFYYALAPRWCSATIVFVVIPGFILLGTEIARRVHNYRRKRLQAPG